MRRTGSIISSVTCYKKIVFSIVNMLLISDLFSQTCTLTDPVFFGLAPPAPQSAFIYCRQSGVGYGIQPSTIGQQYTFEVYPFNGSARKKKGGPLDGNGGTLSVAAFMRSAQDAGEYRVTTTKEGCAESKDTSFYAFYGSIDNLSITAWGSGAVTFRWASCGPKPVVTYQYAVSQQKNPTLVPPGELLTTTDTFATKTGLTNNVVYYIHVRVLEVIWAGSPVDYYFAGCSESQWERIMFTACTGAAALGTLAPVNAVACEGGSATFTATGGATYAWYKDTILTPIAGANSATYSPSVAAQYRLYVTNTGITCKGMIRSGTLTLVPLITGTFSGGGNYYIGDTVRLGISNTITDQTYKILKDGVEVYSMEGVGRDEFTSEDTIWYKFAIASNSQAGHYTVRVSNPWCAPIDFGSQDVFLVTANTICPGANTSFSFLSTGNNTVFQWQVDNGSGFVNIVNNITYAGATTKTLSVTNVQPAMYGYKYRCVCTGGTPVTSSNRILRLGATWTGTTSTAWATATNWSCNATPGATLDAVIQGGPVNQPVISSNVTCRNVWIKTGGNLRINTGFTLTITGP
ncbi:MAG: hypothetical protein JNK14_00170 [Chitinophagaceae bacterium]|nr:hypothetical protein [Chitinophagaceae bacterium]